TSNRRIPRRNRAAGDGRRFGGGERRDAQGALRRAARPVRHLSRRSSGRIWYPSGRQNVGMSRYLRLSVPGSAVFFTVAVARGGPSRARGSDLLVREAGRLRETVAAVRAVRPFAITAWVVLPDHLRAAWTLPEGMRISAGGGKRSNAGSPSGRDHLTAERVEDREG
ncbi:MAG: hypothetical protein K2Q23_11790, partial [Bryobacteraceae bacterium]|nr:hypothetical protein [Bryobacteraceae bacterium]